MVYHKCFNLTLMTGLKVPSANHYMYIDGKSVGATPVCSTRSFQIPAGEHSVEVREWTGLTLNPFDRKARFPAGGTVHLLVDKVAGGGGSAYWSQITPQQAHDLAREIAGANKN